MIDLDQKKILVTGGSGFIGSNFINLIIRYYKSMHIINVDKLGVGSRVFYPDTTNNKYTHIKADIQDIEMLGLNDIKFDYIFHFAAESHVDRSITSPDFFVENNVMGAISLLEYIRKYQPQSRVVNISTDEVYGHLNITEDPFTENSPINPRSPYSASKASSDLLFSSYHTTYDLDILTTRCCNNYGPWQNKEKFIPTVINSLKEGNKIPVYGSGKNIREWIYVDDHNRSILDICMIGISGLVYNIGSGLELSNLEVIKRINDIMGGSDWKDSISYVTDRKGHDFRYSIRSLRYIRGFPIRDFDFGLMQTIEHYTK